MVAGDQSKSVNSFGISAIDGVAQRQGWGMLDMMYGLSDIGLFSLLSCIFISVSIISVLLIRHFVPHELRVKDNQALGSVGALLGLIFGVLVGLTALYLFNNLGYASDAVQHEANAVADIYRDSLWLNNPTRDRMKVEIKNYINNVITVEWPLMITGVTVNHAGDMIIEKIADQLHQYPATTNADRMITNDILLQIKSLYDARQTRINISTADLSTETWVVILIGTILTLAINYLYGMNLSLHLISVTAVALIVASMLFLLMTLDRPFQGEFVVEPDAFRSVLTFIDLHH